LTQEVGQIVFFTRLAVVLIGLSVVVVGSPARGADDAFLIPGADFSRLTLDAGAWCRYLVVDEALDEADSTEIYIGVPQRVETDHGTAYWVEMETRARGAADREPEILKMLILGKIRDCAVGDSLGQYVLRLYIRNGTHPIHEENPRRYEGFSLVVPTTDSTWTSVPDVTIRTGAGEFTALRKQRTVTDDREIKTGKVTIVKKSSDSFSVWFSDQVPVFHLVRCEIDRSRETTTEPRLAGIPVAGDRRSKTTAELTSYGHHAKEILPLEPLNE
jgi:hypothetical protein